MNQLNSTKAALWVRVSTDQQSTANQLDALRAEAERRGYAVVAEFDLADVSAYNGKHAARLYQALEGARRGDFNVLLVWALDRLSRQGAESMLRVVREFSECGCRVVSLQESWTEVPAEVLPLLLSVAGWVAQQESKRRSERTLAGLARVAKLGHRPGRPIGRKDSKPRKRHVV